MTEKLTDAEIIKALELCTMEGGVANCVDCPLANDTFKECSDKLLRNSKALINRQKEQIEGLQDEVVIKTDMLNNQKADIEKINIYCENLEISQNHLLNELAIARKTAKSEAYREFAKFLVDKDNKGVIHTMDLCDYVIELTEKGE